MSGTFNSASDPGQPMVYQIRIKGHLSSKWADWFEDLTITALDNGETLLTGPVVDQAALYGLLRKVRDVGLPLLSVGPVEPDNAEEKARQCNASLAFKKGRNNENNDQDHHHERQESHAFPPLDLRDVQLYVCGYSDLVL